MTLLPNVYIYREHKLSAVFLFCHEVTFLSRFYWGKFFGKSFLFSCKESAGDTSPSGAGVKIGLAESR